MQTPKGLAEGKKSQVLMYSSCAVTRALSETYGLCYQPRHVNFCAWMP